MKKKTPYLDFYYKCIDRGQMPEPGLCYIFDRDKLFPLFIPDFEETETLSSEGYQTIFWGRLGIIDGRNPFTPLRQTIVLFMAALNKEL